MAGDRAVDAPARQGIQVAEEDHRRLTVRAADPVRPQQGARLYPPLPASDAEMGVEHLDLDTIDVRKLNACIAAYNNTPRKCLGFLTPAQVFLGQVLHFNCESTPSLRSG